MDYEMLLSGRNGFALQYGNFETLWDSEKLSDELRSGTGT